MTTPEAVERRQPEYERAVKERWIKLGSFAVQKTLAPDAARKYILDMFPFPSGSGLHMGHVKGYTATDVLSHYYRRKGEEVLHPMGWDSFGLPAETAAIKDGVMPQDYTEENIAVFKEQMQQLGLIYDWDREIKTSDPEYFHWTQSTFLDMYDKGLAYYSNEPINWCEECATTLANEDLEGSLHDRCGTEVTRKLSPQWAIDMRSSAERLLVNLEGLPEWERSIVEAQMNWIGKKEGHVLRGGIVSAGGTEALPIFMAKDSAADTSLSPAIHSVAVSPQKALQLAEEGYAFSPEVMEYIDKKLIIPNQERRKSSILTGHAVTIGEHEFQLAVSEEITDKRYGAAVLGRQDANVSEDAGVSIEELRQSGLVEDGATYEINDWVFSRQRYWGEPIPVVRDAEGTIYPLAADQLPLTLPEVESIPAGKDGESPLAQIRSWVEARGYVDADGKFHADPDSETVFLRETDTMPNWAGSSAYYKRYLDPHNSTTLVSPEADAEFPQVDIYVGGMEHATRHLIYARFWNQFLYDTGMVQAEEPFKKVQHVGLVLGSDGRKMSKSKGNGVNPSDMVAAYGADATRLGVFEMGDFAKTTVWDEAKIASSSKFLERVWKMQEKLDPDDDLNDDLKLKINETIDTAGRAIESFRFGIAISSVKALFNVLSSYDTIPREAYNAAVSLLQPFAPHIAEAILAPGEIRHKQDQAAYKTWPEKYAVQTVPAASAQTAVIMGGKVVEQLELAGDEDERRETLQAMGYRVLKDLSNRSKKPMIVVTK